MVCLRCLLYDQVGREDRRVGRDVLAGHAPDHRVPLAAIRYLEAYGNFVKVHTGDETILASTTLSRLEELLTAGRFLRVHRSYIVAVSRVARVSSSTVGVGERRIPIGRSYRREALRMLRGGWREQPSGD